MDPNATLSGIDRPTRLDHRVSLCKDLADASILVKRAREHADTAEWPSPEAEATFCAHLTAASREVAEAVARLSDLVFDTVGLSEER